MKGKKKYNYCRDRGILQSLNLLLKVFVMDTCLYDLYIYVLNIS